MSSSDEQAAKVATGLVQDAKMPPPLELDDWRALVAPWTGRMRMSTEVVVGQLHQLIERCARAEEMVAKCQHWSFKNVNGDGLRKVLYPSRYPAPPDDACVFCDRPLQPYTTCLCTMG